MRTFLLPAAVFISGWIVTNLLAEVVANGPGYPPLYAFVWALLFPTVFAVSLNVSGQPVSVGWTVELTAISCLLVGGFPLLHDPVLATVYYIVAALVFITATWLVTRFFPGAIGNNPE